MTIGHEVQPWRKIQSSVGDAEVFAIGDVHGCADLLAAALSTVETTRRIAAERTLVLLGDLIDRGPDSLGCLDLAIAASPGERIDILGNHEQMLRIALTEGPDRNTRGCALQVWYQNGGRRVCDELQAWDVAGIRRGLGEARVRHIDGMRPWHRIGDVLFVHAGISPDIPADVFLSAPWIVGFDGGFDEDAHWAWVRTPFHDHEPGAAGHGDGVFVVHGHERHERIGTEAMIARHRINLDGGSYATGRIRMARIVGDRLQLHVFSRTAADG